MKIAVVGHIRYPIARPFMGGMESHSHQLVEALTTRGHNVTLFAAPGSDALRMHPICDAPLQYVFPTPEWSGTDELISYQNAAYLNAWSIISNGDFDIVHNNSLNSGIIDWARERGTAMVTSLHVPPFPKMRASIERSFKDETQQITVTSHDQLRRWDAETVPNVRVVHNGIDADLWRVNAGYSGRLLWFGRIVENKGLREAVKAASRCGEPMDIAGNIEDPEYFRDHVEPFLSDKLRYVGHLSGKPLREFVAKARAVVVTPMWDEPFGLVAAEAMSCGVPVIAFDRGALREVVGPCGVIVPPGNVRALASAMSLDLTAEAAGCRTRVEANFSIARMIGGYEAAYTKAIKAAQVIAI